MIRILTSIDMMDYAYSFTDVEPNVHSRDEPHLIVVRYLLNMFLNVICQDFVKDFCISIHQRYQSKIFFP